ncbi:MAG: hypothetical protein AAGM22_26850 [Acidobacteriota bacterium]
MARTTASRRAGIETLEAHHKLVDQAALAGQLRMDPPELGVQLLDVDMGFL